MESQDYKLGDMEYERGGYSVGRDGPTKKNVIANIMRNVGSMAFGV